jgi:transposase-like protein
MSESGLPPDSTPPDATAFRWDRRRERAAQLLGEDELTYDEVAAEVGANRRTLFRWLEHAAFRERVGAVARETVALDRRYAVARRCRRVRSLDDRVRRMERVIEERAASPQMEGVPGGRTGLMVHTVKGVGRGDDFRLIDLYEVDAGLLKELREHEKQAAQELGQWLEKVEHGGEGMVVRFVERVVHADGGRADQPAPDPEGLPG